MTNNEPAPWPATVRMHPAPEWHEDEAARLLAAVRNGDFCVRTPEYVARAQAHATLALAVRMRPAERPPAAEPDLPPGIPPDDHAYLAEPAALRCSATLTIRDRRFRCDALDRMAAEARDHTGLPHSNRDARATWQ